MKVLLNSLNIEIVGGQILSRITSEAENSCTLGTIVAKTITDGYIDPDNIVYNSYKNEIDERRITKNGDIVIKLTAPFGAAKINNEHAGLLVSSFCSIIRLDDDKIDADYLVTYLNSDICKRKVEKLMIGSGIQTLSLKSFRSIDIPLPGLHMQHIIAENYNRYIKNKMLVKRLQILQKEKVESMLAAMEENHGK